MRVDATEQTLEQEQNLEAKMKNYEFLRIGSVEGFLAITKQNIRCIVSSRKRTKGCQ